MTQYYKISTDEFESFLADYDAEPVDLDGVKELVYDIPTAYDYLTVRVYSSLAEGAARDVGRDAIRVTVFDDHHGRNVDGATRTHRIDTWASNLAPKIDAMLARVDAGEFESDDPLAAAKAHTFDTEDGDAGTITVVDVFENSYGDLRAKLDGDTYHARDAIKFDWTQTHHDFDGTDNTWAVDVAAIPALADELHSDGFTLVRAEDQDDGFDAADFASQVRTGDRVVVTYAKKTGTGAAEKTGTVTDVMPGRVAFRRDEDEHLMFVRDDSLYTAGSHYPFVGTVEDAVVA